MDQSDGRRVSRRKTGRGRALARVRGPDIRRKCGMLRVSRVDTVCGARPAPPRAGRGKTAVPSRSPAAAAVALLCLRWHTFAGMDSAADIEVIDGGEEESVDSVAEAEADCDGGGRSADVHVGQKLA